MHPEPSDAAVFLNTQAHVIVAVVGVHADQHGPLDLEGPLEDRRDLIGCADHEASRSECPAYFTVSTGPKATSDSRRYFSSS
jgi:hypothetical protein